MSAQPVEGYNALIRHGSGAYAPFETPTPTEACPPDFIDELCIGLSTTPRLVLQIAPDLHVTNPQLVYNALWAPHVIADMLHRSSEVAFLTRDRLTEVTGLDGQRAMIAGGLIETDPVGLIRMVGRGEPGAVPLGGKRGWRGNATCWTVNTDPAAYTHTPGATGATGRAAPDGLRRIDTGEYDRHAMEQWLHPRFPWWKGRGGLTALRLVANLLRRFGGTDVILETRDAATITGTAERTAQRTMAVLAAANIASPTGQSGQWLIRLASYLAPLTYDDIKHLAVAPWRPPSPENDKQIHDWAFFSPDGRSARQRALSILDSHPEDVAPGAPIRKSTGRPWGGLIRGLKLIRLWTRMGVEAARTGMQAALSAPVSVFQPFRLHGEALDATEPAQAFPEDPDAPAPPWAASPTTPGMQISQQLFPWLHQTSSHRRPTLPQAPLARAPQRPVLQDRTPLGPMTARQAAKAARLAEGRERMRRGREFAEEVWRQEEERRRANPVEIPSVRETTGIAYDADNQIPLAEKLRVIAQALAAQKPLAE